MINKDNEAQIKSLHAPQFVPCSCLRRLFLEEFCARLDAVVSVGE